MGNQGGDDPVARWMYDRAFDNYKLLADIRFKLLALVPIVTAVGAAFAEKATDLGRVVLGSVGLLVTLGVIFYEQRNTSHYDNAIGVAKKIEEELKKRDLLPTDGVFTSRATVTKRRFLGAFDMWHDRALAIIYATSFGVWMFVLVYGVSSHFRFLDVYPPVWAGIATVVMFVEFSRHPSKKAKTTEQKAAASEEVKAA